MLARTPDGPLFVAWRERRGRHPISYNGSASAFSTFEQEQPMLSRIIIASVATATVVSGASADITYVSANRRVEAWASGWITCFEELESDHDVVSSTEFGPFIESITAQAGLDDWGSGSASQSTDLLPYSFGGSGAASWSRAGGCQTSGGTGESWFEVTIELDRPMSFTLVGHVEGLGFYSFTGPGLDITGDEPFNDINIDFDESGELPAGTYTFIVLARTDVSVEEGTAAFSLDVQLIDPVLCPADITGPDAQPDGRVDALDLLALLGDWGSPCNGACAADITGPTPLAPDGNVDALDFLLLVSQWGAPGNCP